MLRKSENMYICDPTGVISSVGSERCLDRAEVSSSSLLSPTTYHDSPAGRVENKKQVSGNV